MPRFSDLSGQKFNRLTILSQYDRDANFKIRYTCQCDCGNKIIASGAAVKRGNTKSCGCLKKEALSVKGKNIIHGMLGTPEYRAWQSAKARCQNKSDKDYHRYGGRGIIFCDEWTNSFSRFLEDMGLRPSPQHSIDRINNNGNYEPGNCRWATIKEQSRNRRSSRIIQHNGVSRTMIEWSEIYEVPYLLLKARISKQKWPISKAIEVGI